MTKKRFALVSLGVLGVCVPTTYAFLMVGMAQAFGYADWGKVWSDVWFCAIIVALGICAIYFGLKGRKRSA